MEVCYIVNAFVVRT